MISVVAVFSLDHIERSLLLGEASKIYLEVGEHERAMQVGLEVCWVLVDDLLDSLEEIMYPPQN